jgi:formylglycine-generating enzyme required for sulfatase activity
MRTKILLIIAVFINIIFFFPHYFNAFAASGMAYIGVNAQGYKEYRNKKSGMVLVKVPAGEFWMGSPQNEGNDDEHPRHKVYLDAYYIGKYEVTNEQFARFVNQTGYSAQGDWKKYYRSNSASHPVVNVSWIDAKTYCEWAGLRLPTEAEWEKAARGTDSREYPWGNKWDAGKCNNFSGPRLSGMANLYNGRGTLPVGSFSKGASPYGAMDMAGNVYEWCADWYDENYYQKSSSYNPKGPYNEAHRVLRGGSWYGCDTNNLRTAFRYWYSPVLRSHICNGFRCASFTI